MARHTDGRAFDKKHYYAHPEEYEGYFEEYLPYVQFLVQDIYWEAKYPRTLTSAGLADAVKNKKSRFMGLTDVSADYEGSIEFTSRFTSIEEPFLLYNPIDMTFKEKISEMAEHDILFHSVDHLPAEMPKEASNHFGSKLMPFIERVVKSDFTKPFVEQTDLPAEIEGAIITCHGALTPNYEYIAKLRELNSAVQPEEGTSSHGM